MHFISFIEEQLDEKLYALSSLSNDNYRLY